MATDATNPGAELPELTRQQALALLVHTAESLGWVIVHLSDAGIAAYARLHDESPETTFIARLEERGLELYCNRGGEGRGNPDGDQELIRLFLDRYHSLQASVPREFLQERYDSFGAMLTVADERDLPFPPPTARERAANVFAMFRPTRGYAVTPVLLIANVAVFLLMLLNGASVMDPSSEVLIRWGANYTPETLAGGWWRLLSNVFIHIGVIHLALNMYALLYIGALLEPRIGSLRFGLSYLLTGIAASLASLWWHPVILSAGASGAIFGMYGLFLAMLTTNLIEKDTRNSMLSSIGIFVGYNLLFGMQGGVDNAAHIGGLISGALIGYAFYPSLRRPERARLRRATILALVAVAGGMFILAAKNIHSDMVTYQQNMQRFSANEQRFIRMIQAADPADAPAYMDTIRTSIGIWEENLRLAASGNVLEGAMNVQSDRLVRYSQLRLQELRLILRSAAGDTSGNAQQMTIQLQVSQLLDSLNKP